MTIISAMTRDRVIGSGDGMPWHVPEEYQRFLDIIEGQTVIMGRRSYSIFGPDLTSACNVVLSRSSATVKGAIICGSVEEAVNQAASFGTSVFCAGGASIYRQTIPMADAMYLSFIKGQYTGDTFFPDVDFHDWNIESKIDHPNYEFVIYKRSTGPSK